MFCHMDQDLFQEPFKLFFFFRFKDLTPGEKYKVNTTVLLSSRNNVTRYIGSFVNRK